MVYRLRGTLAFLAALFEFGVLGAFGTRFIVWPLTLIFPARRDRFVSWFARLTSVVLLKIFSAIGGARFRRRGTIPTEEPVVIIMNHQSLLDIPTAMVMTEPYVPTFVTRKRYSRYIPNLSLTLRLLDAPIVDTKDREGAIEVIRKGALTQRHGILIFPEGHRSRDGEIGPFKTAGLQTLLQARRLPLYLLVTDGFWSCATLLDHAFNVHRLNGRTEVLGPFTVPDDADLTDFLADMRGRMQAQLALMRSEAGHT